MFSGGGQTLSGRTLGMSPTSSSKGKHKEIPSTHIWGIEGRVLGSSSAGIPRPSDHSRKVHSRERSLTPDFGVDDDDDVIMISDDE